MEKISLLLFALLFSITCFGQQVSKVVDVILPKGVEKLSQKQVESFSTINNSTPTVRKGMDYYRIDSIEIGFLDIHETAGFQESFENRIKGLKYDYVGTHTNVNTAIKTFNNMRYLIYSYDDYGKSFIRFYTEFHNDWALSGLIRFDKPNAQKATEILYSMLNTVKFKD